LSAIEQGDWLWVDTDAAEREFEKGELLIILKDDTVKAGTPFEQEPLQPPLPYRYQAQFEGKMADRQQVLVILSSDLEQTPVNDVQIYGYVAGVWSFYRNVQNRNRLWVYSVKQS